MGDAYQIVGDDGQVSAHVDARKIELAIAAGRLLPTEQLKTSDGRIVELAELAAFRQQLTAQFESSQSVSGQEICRLIAGFLSKSRSGHLHIAMPDGHRSMWSFVHGALVSIRPAPEPVGDASLPKPTRMANAIGEIIQATCAAQELDIRYFDDAKYSPQSPQAHLPLRGVLELSLASALSIEEMTTRLGELGDLARGQQQLPEYLQADQIDRQILRGCLQYGASARAIEALAKAMNQPRSLTTIRLMRLYVTGHFSSRGASKRELQKLKRALEPQNFFERLDIPTTLDESKIEDAFTARLRDLGIGNDAPDHAEHSELKDAIRNLLTEARDVLADAAQRAVYRRAMQTGVDFSDPVVREPMLREYYLTQGKALLDRGSYAEAEALLEAAVRTNRTQPRVHILLGWANYLNSNETKDAADAALNRVRVALEFDSNSDEAYLAMGKICRLAGMKDDAKRYLTQATTLNGDNNEAWAQLRLLNTQRTGRQKVKIDLEVGQGVAPIIITALFVLLGLYAGANLLEGGATEWPMLEDGSQLQSVKGHGETPAWLKKVHAKRQAAQSFDIPKAKQVMGNIESYLIPDDKWFWTRRAVLFVMGILGVVAIARRRLSDIRLIEKGFGWLLLGTLYGIIVGFLSPLPMTPTGLGPALGMMASHALAEQLFFTGFVGLSLLDRTPSPAVALLITAALFGLHQLTFFATLSLPPSVMLTGVLQMTAFAGGAYAFLMWRTNGILAPLLAQIAIVSVMVFRCIQAYGG
ncbi:MAG: tetratricopeptide repeat protein [Bradymonadia bacterium]